MSHRDDVAARTYWVFASGVLVTKAPEGWRIVNRDWWLPNLWRLHRASR